MISRLYQDQLGDLLGLGRVGSFWLIHRTSDPWSAVPSQREVSRLLSVPRRTVRDHWHEVLAASQYDLNAGSGWWHPVSASLRASLLSLASHGRAGFSALKVLVNVWGPLRSARYHKRTMISAADRFLARLAGIARGSVRGALDLLEAAGLVKQRSAWGRRFLATSSPVATARAVREPGVGGSRATLPIRVLSSGKAKHNRAPHGAVVSLTEVRRVVACELGGRGGPAEYIARLAGTVERLRSWIAQESKALVGTVNPFGALMFLATKCKSRPGRPSGVVLEAPSMGNRGSLFFGPDSDKNNKSRPAQPARTIQDEEALANHNQHDSHIDAYWTHELAKAERAAADERAARALSLTHSNAARSLAPTTQRGTE